jgi:DHA2 family multidrug resistance protein
MTSEQITRSLQYRGLGNSLSEQGGPGVIYRELLRQASMLSFNDAFHIVSIIMICILPLVFFMRRGKPGISPGMH